MNTIKIENIIYEIVQEKTADDLDAEKLHNVARLMRSNKIVAQMLLRRPKGIKVYFCNKYAPSKYGIGYSRPFSL